MKSTHTQPSVAAQPGEPQLETSMPPGVDRSHVRLLASVLGESEEVVLAALLAGQTTLACVPFVAKRGN